MAYLRLYEQQFVTTTSEYGTNYENGLGAEIFETLEEVEKAVRENGGWVVETMDVKLVKSTPPIKGKD